MNEQNTSHMIKTGDIFKMEWGYDQTNVNFFQVTRTTNKGVYVREIGKISVSGTQGFMCEDVIANPNSFLTNSQWCGGFNRHNPETFRRLSINKDSFSFRGRYTAFLQKENKPTYTSWYA